ncbi:MAG: metallophosphoesterase family protein [Lewinella sp.]|uniref:metallophosphoesterase family protein n=1 Tax=Lewinella sp. TaxID=2004506 RepID=UPI003D6B95CC
MTKNTFVFLIFVLILSGCADRPPRAYTFFVAGHTYGVKEKPTPGLHMPFVAEFDYLNQYTDMRFGVLTGDIVYYSNDTSWNHVDQQLTQLKAPTHFTTGNHDEGHKSPYKDRYGITYSAFEQENDLCILLNPGLGGWNIWGEQMAFLKETLATAPKYDNIFLFFHHLVWWAPDNEYKQYRPNSLDGRAPEVNFLSEVMPMLIATEKPVYCFAGDVAAAGNLTAFFADRKDNVHLVASGMGNNKTDNYLLITVDEQKQVTVTVRWIQEGREEVIFPEVVR